MIHFWTPCSHLGFVPLVAPLQPLHGTLGELRCFCHPKFEGCCQMNNWVDSNQANHCPIDNHQVVNLTKTLKISYPTHHLRLTPLDLWMTHLQCTNEGLQKYLMGRTLHRHKLESIKSLKTMILNESPHDDSRKLSWHFLWNT